MKKDSYDDSFRKIELKHLEDIFRLNLEYDKNTSLEELINESHNQYLFTNEDYYKTYINSKKKNETSSITSEYNDII